jgi:hypothetical protein
MKNLVIMESRSTIYKEDATWCCKTEDEAKNLVRWLNDNGVPAIQITLETFNRMPQNPFDGYHLSDYKD